MAHNVPQTSPNIDQFVLLALFGKRASEAHDLMMITPIDVGYLARFASDYTLTGVLPFTGLPDFTCSSRAVSSHLELRAHQIIQESPDSSFLFCIITCVLYTCCTS